MVAYASNCIRYAIRRSVQFVRYHHCKSRQISSKPNKMKFVYPTAREVDTVDVYHGCEVKDPYRWMEDPENPEVKKYIDEQNDISRPYLNGFKDREQLASGLRKMWNYPKYSCPSRHGSKYFFYKNSGLQNQSILYVKDSLDGEATEFLDPNSLSPDGTVSLSGTKFSEDGKTFAYGLSTSGSDWIVIHFKDVESGKDYSEVLTKVKFSSMAWTHDNKGIFYGRYTDEDAKAEGTETEQNHNQKLYYHRIGTNQSEDVLVAEFPEEPEYRIGCEVSDCGRWLILTPIKGCKNNLIYVGDLSSVNEITEKIPLKPVVEQLVADYEYVTNHENYAIFRTNKDAPNYRLVMIDLNNPEEGKWKTLIEEHPSDVLDWASPINNNQLVVCYIHEVKNVLSLHSAATGEKIMNFPLEMGTITRFSGKKHHTECFYFFTSFVNPGLIYRVDFSTGEPITSVYQQINIPDFDPTKFQTHQVYYTSKDGTKVPMFLVSRANTEKDPSRACLLYGYGGFNVSIQPVFSLLRIMFIQHFDGLLAVPSIRGGGEYGEKWHNAGRFLNKQNVFDDFQYAGKYLIENGYTSNKRLTIQGGSNGGLLVAACLNQARELFQVGLIHVGVMDMLRFHKFTIGYAWTSDYGCSDDEVHFKNLLSYSPLHNIKPDNDHQYPCTLLLTADHDDRVVPSHSLKFIATLQKTLGNQPNQENPLLIRVETKAGHGSGKPTSKLIEEAVDVLCFIARSLDLKFVEN